MVSKRFRRLFQSSPSSPSSPPSPSPSPSSSSSILSNNDSIKKIPNTISSKIPLTTNSISTIDSTNCFSTIASKTFDFHGDDAIGFGANYIIVSDGVSGTKTSSSPLANLLVSSLSDTLSNITKEREKLYIKKYKNNKKNKLINISTIQSNLLNNTIFNNKINDLLNINLFFKYIHTIINKTISNVRKKLSHIGRLDATLLIVYFDKITNLAFIYTIGDCKCILIRPNNNNNNNNNNNDNNSNNNGNNNNNNNDINMEIIFESTSVIYDFNVPTVVSTNDTMNCVHNANIEIINYKSNDFVLVCSDGITDNLFTYEIIDIIIDNIDNNINNNTALNMVNKLIEKGKNKFNNNNNNTKYIPFAVAASYACEKIGLEKRNVALNDKKNKKEIDISNTFINICQNLPCRKQNENDIIKQHILIKEKKIKNIKYYSVVNLLSFAKRLYGKQDDMSICIGKLN